MNISKEKVAAALKVLQVLAEAIREAGEDGVPAGHLYAATMSHLSLDSFESAISHLVRANLVRRENHVLVWIGPKLDKPNEATDSK